MTNNDIILTIRNIQKEFSLDKDGGRSFVEALAKKIDNTIDEEKDEVVNFLLQEIESDTNKLCSLALGTAEFLNVPGIADKIEEIYKRQQKTKEKQWKRNVLMILLKKRHPSDVYDDYLTDNPINCDSFHFLVYYANLYPQKGIPLLSDCLIKDLHIRDLLPSEAPNNFVGFTSFLLNLINPPEELVTPLVQIVYEKDTRSGEHLMKFMMHLLRHYPHSFPKVLVDDIFSDLKKIERCNSRRSQES